MVYISEWLPNPAGNDAAGEWVELWNAGPDTADLSGWRLVAGTGKGHALQGVRLAAGERVVLHRKSTKLTLKNADGSIALISAAGAEADRVAFVGTAPEGKSANRGMLGRAFFADQTPGATNAQPSLALIGNSAPEFGTVRIATPAVEVVLVGAVCAMLFACAVIFIIKKNHALEELFVRSH